MSEFIESAVKLGMLTFWWFGPLLGMLYLWREGKVAGKEKDARTWVLVCCILAIICSTAWGLFSLPRYVSDVLVPWANSTPKHVESERVEKPHIVLRCGIHSNNQKDAADFIAACSAGGDTYKVRSCRRTAVETFCTLLPHVQKPDSDPNLDQTYEDCRAAVDPAVVQACQEARP